MLAAIFGGGAAYDYGTRYYSWANLSKQELIESAQWYVRERAPGHAVCLYAVTCNEGTARLILVKDVNSWDIEAAKKLAWDRRFKDYCPGRTANFALKVAEGDADLVEARKQAVWSFSLDRFTPRWGRFHGFHAFSEGDAEPCTAEHAIVR